MDKFLIPFVIVLLIAEYSEQLCFMYKFAKNKYLWKTKHTYILSIVGFVIRD